MNCKYHKDMEAKFICEKCKQPVCEECVTDVAGKNICSHCVQKALFDTSRHVRGGFWEKALFFCFSLFPGAAHMYMGLFRRGFQLMMGFLGPIFIFSYVNFESIIPLLVIPIWFFSFFDSYYIRKRIKAGEMQEDIEVLDYNLLLENKKYIGLGILVLGLLGFVNSFQYVFDGLGGRFWGHINNLYFAMKRSIIPIILIFAGIYMIKRSRVEAEAPAEAFMANTDQEPVLENLQEPMQ